MLVGTDICVRMVFMWEETEEPGGNPPVGLGDQMTISHADAGYRTRLTAVRGECVNTWPARQPNTTLHSELGITLGQPDSQTRRYTAS